MALIHLKLSPRNIYSMSYLVTSMSTCSMMYVCVLARASITDTDGETTVTGGPTIGILAAQMGVVPVTSLPEHKVTMIASKW